MTLSEYAGAGSCAPVERKTSVEVDEDAGRATCYPLGPSAQGWSSFTGYDTADATSQVEITGTFGG